MIRAILRPVTFPASNRPGNMIKRRSKKQSKPTKSKAEGVEAGVAEAVPGGDPDVSSEEQSAEESIGNPEEQGDAYTVREWDDATYAMAAERADPEPCPRCNRTGFYGPRAMDHGKKFRQCRFCGFLQNVGKAPVQLRPVAHRCDGWPEVADAPYLWWIDPDEKWYTCPYCSKKAPVKSTNPFSKGAGVKAPADDPDHPWWNVPQGASYATYVKFWESWPITTGRVVL